MTWQTKKQRRWVDVDTIGRFGRTKHLKSIDVGLEDEDFKLGLPSEDVRYKIHEPTLAEVLTHKVHANREYGTITELEVCIHNGARVLYIETSHLTEHGKTPMEHRFYFNNDKPGSFEASTDRALEILAFHIGSFYYSPYQSQWPRKDIVVVDEHLNHYFEDLKEFRPDAASSLDKCIRHLQDFYPANRPGAKVGPLRN